jgi:hypothetical protein
VEEEDEEENGEDEDKLEEQKNQISRWEGEVLDIRLGPEEIDALPRVGRAPKPKMRVQSSKKKEETREKLMEELMKQRLDGKLAPIRELIKPNKAVSWLPYDSIEVVFNDTHLYANRQNHHPACITYDFDTEESVDDYTEKGKWEPLFKKEHEKIPFHYLSPNAKVEPMTAMKQIDDLRDNLRTEMKENILLYRGKRGFDTFFDESDGIMNQLEDFLQIQEEWQIIDPDGDLPTMLLQKIAQGQRPSPSEKFILEKLGLRQWNKNQMWGNGDSYWCSPHFDGSAKDYSMYQGKQSQRWDNLQSRIEKFLKHQDSFPTKRGHKFSGFPVHFSTCDQDLIRSHLMQIKEYETFINMKSSKLFYSVQCCIYPLLGGVMSVWLYIGMQELMKQEMDEGEEDDEGGEEP